MAVRVNVPLPPFSPNSTTYYRVPLVIMLVIMTVTVDDDDCYSRYGSR